MSNPEKLFRIVAICALVWALVLCGCATHHPYQITEIYAPVPSETVIEVSRQAVVGQCLKTLPYEYCANADGLTRIKYSELGERCTVYLADDLPPWKRACILNHERKHCHVGDFHPNKRHGGCQ